MEDKYPIDFSHYRFLHAYRKRYGLTTLKGAKNMLHNKLVAQIKTTGPPKHISVIMEGKIWSVPKAFVKRAIEACSK